MKQADRKQVASRPQAGSKQAASRQQAGSKQAASRQQAGSKQAASRHQAGSEQAASKQQAGSKQAASTQQAGRKQVGKQAASSKHSRQRAKWWFSERIWFLVGVLNEDLNFQHRPTDAIKSSTSLYSAKLHETAVLVGFSSNEIQVLMEKSY
jgi:hypothetical protein